MDSRHGLLHKLTLLGGVCFALLAAPGPVGCDPNTQPTLPGFTALPSNPATCPTGAPANPIGPCVGVPVYTTCAYTNGARQYTCICDWVHWLCI